MSDEQRFYIDQRVGCVAVRDRTQDDPDHPGLSSDTSGVVKFWDGELVLSKCPTCGHPESRYAVSDAALAAAIELRNELNANPPPIVERPAEPWNDWAESYGP